MFFLLPFPSFKNYELLEKQYLISITSETQELCSWASRPSSSTWWLGFPSLVGREKTHANCLPVSGRFSSLPFPLPNLTVPSFIWMRYVLFLTEQPWIASFFKNCQYAGIMILQVTSEWIKKIGHNFNLFHQTYYFEISLLLFWLLSKQQMCMDLHVEKGLSDCSIFLGIQVHWLVQNSQEGKGGGGQDTDSVSSLVH